MFFFCLLPLPDNMLSLLLCLMCTRAQPHQLADIIKGVALAACLHFKDMPPQVMFPAVVLAMIMKIPNRRTTSQECTPPRRRHSE